MMEPARISNVHYYLCQYHVLVVSTSPINHSDIFAFPSISALILQVHSFPWSEYSEISCCPSNCSQRGSMNQMLTDQAQTRESYDKKEGGVPW